MPQLSPGDQIHDSSIIKSLGDGQFGEVYEASCLTFPLHNVALKVCKHGINADDQARFDRENETLHKLSPHDRIISPLSKIKVDGANRYYLMELADGNLSTFLYQTSTFSDQDRLELFIKICEGLEHAHGKSVIHRDLWWGNVLVKNNNGGADPKLNDFGRSRDFQLNDPSYQPKNVWGIKWVVPPEIFLGLWNDPSEKDYTVSDIYALGILLFFIINVAPIDYLSLVKATMVNFNDWCKANSIVHSTPIDFYEAWLKWVAPKKLESNLKVIISDKNLNDNINDLIYNLCNLDYRKRPQTVSEVIKTVRSF